MSINNTSDTSASKKYEYSDLARLSSRIYAANSIKAYANIKYNLFSVC